MKIPSSLSGLPASLLLLLSAQIAKVRADSQHLPTAIRKMGTNAEEKILHEYLAFSTNDDDTTPQAAVSAPGFLTPAEQALLAANSSTSIHYRAPLAAHLLSSDSGGGGAIDARRDIDPWESFHRGRMVEARLAKRDFSCPTGTASCAAIGYPNSCCQAGATCVQIADTGLGPVGCCPSGESCTGTIACTGDQEGCSSESGGGCCIPGWSCASVGCTQSGAAVPSTTTVTSTSTSTSTLPITTTSSTSSDTTSPTTSPTGTTSVTTTTTGDASAPVRPTSGTTTTASYCPTGFYACSAVYGGGCCQTGRDCQTTNCPSTAYTTIISSGVTIAVPASDVTATTTGTCAGGWSLCPTDADAGAIAGCCPSGYDCGTASCFLATGSATASVAKELPGSSGAGRREDVRWSLGVIPALLGFAFGVAMI